MTRFCPNCNTPLTKKFPLGELVPEVWEETRRGCGNAVKFVKSQSQPTFLKPRPEPTLGKGLSYQEMYYKWLLEKEGFIFEQNKGNDR